MPLQETEFSDSLGVLPYLCGNLNWEGARRGGHWGQLGGALDPVVASQTLLRRW